MPLTQNSCESSLNILTNINEKFVIQLTKEIKILSREEKESCKVIHLSSEWSFEESLVTLDKLNLKEYPSLFILIIEPSNLESRSDDQNDIGKLTKNLLKIGEGRPIIIQLTSKNETKFCYKEENSNQFNIIERINENFEDGKNFSVFLCSFLRGGIQIFDHEMINKITKSQSCALILRFLWTLGLNENFYQKIILEVSKHGSKGEFLAALDSSFEDHGRILNDQAQLLLSETISTDSSSKQNKDADVEPNMDSSVFLTAVKHQNKEIIDYLITYWTVLIQQLPFEHQMKISSTAFETTQLDVLCDLLEIADFPFPENFNSDSVNHDRLRKIVTSRKAFKDAIEAENFQKLDEFIDNNLNLKIAFNLENVSAMNQALDLKKFKAYFYLKAFGFQETSCIDLDEVLTEEELEQAKSQANKQKNRNVKEALRDIDSPVMLLSTRCVIHNRRTKKEKEAEYRVKIKKWLGDIYKIKFGPELLTTAALCENLKIIFDFESDKVDRIDLLSNAMGLSYSTVSSNIFIGAKLSDDQREQEIKGTLAHEICHYVMYLVYENQFLPYYKYDVEIQSIFDDIVIAIDQWSMPESENPDDECNDIISSVFTAYHSKSFSLELIVRVVHILAEYDTDPQKSEYLQEKYKILFEFWETFVIPELNKFNIEIRKKVKKLNDYVGLLPSIENESIKLCNLKDLTELMDNQLIIVSTNISKLLFINIYRMLDNTFGNLIKTHNFFTDPAKLNNHQIWFDFNKISKRSTKLNIFVDCSKGVPDYLGNIFVNKKLNFIFVVINERQSVELIAIFNEEKIQNITKLEVNYDWNDLTKESQESLFQTQINFQNNPAIILSNLLQNSEKESINDFHEAINDKLLNMLVENKQISINGNNEKDLNDQYFDLLFQKRTFIKNDSAPDAPDEVKKFVSESKLISEMRSKKYVLISDVAGNGKSWVMKNLMKVIREKYSATWVSYVDLKQFIEEFKGIDQELNFSKFIAEKILKLKKHEKGLFKRLYTNGRVVILFDGFDEIAPNCADFVTKLAKAFEFNEGNQLWIATRDYFRINLLHELNLDVSYSINELSKESGTNLIAENWFLSDMKGEIEVKSRNEFIEYLRKSSKFKTYLEEAAKIIQEIQDSANDSIGMPQLYKMVADGFKKGGNTLQTLCLGEIYSRFIQRLCKRWSHEKGQIRVDASVECQKYELSFWKFHQYFAIKGVFPELINVLFPGYDGSEWPIEEVIACGLMTKKGDSYLFLHETFREFFVADFLAKTLTKIEADSLLKQKCREKNFYVIIAKILTQEKYWVIQVFLNDSIDQSTLDKIQPEMQKLINNFYEIERFSNLFSKNMDKLAGLILKILKSGDYEKVKKILNGNAKIISSDTKNSSLFEKFYNFLFDFLRSADLKDLITNQQVFLEIISSNLGIDVFEKFVEITETKTDRGFIQETLKMEHYDYMRFNIFCSLCACKNLTDHKVRKFLEITRKFLSFDEMLNKMQNCSIKKYNVLMNSMMLNESNFKIVWKEIEKLCANHGASKSFIDLVKQKHYGIRNILHEAAFSYEIESVKIIWEILSETFQNREELKDFVLERTDDGQNYFHLLVNRNKYSSAFLFDVFEVVKNYLNDAQFKEILLANDPGNMNILNIVASGNKSTFEVLYRVYRSSFKSDQFLKILKEKDTNGRNVLNITAANTSNDVFMFLIEELEAVFTSEEIKQLMLNNGNTKGNLLYSAARNQSEMFHKHLWKTLRKYFTSTEIKELIKYAEDAGENLLFRIVHDNTRDTLEITWNEIKSIMSHQEQVDLLKTNGKNGKNLIEKDFKFKNAFHKQEAYDWVVERMIEYKIYKYNEIHELVKV